MLMRHPTYHQSPISICNKEAESQFLSTAQAAQRAHECINKPAAFVGTDLAEPAGKEDPVELEILTESANKTNIKRGPFCRGQPRRGIGFLRGSGS